MYPIKEFSYLSPDYNASVKLRNDVFRKPHGLEISAEDLAADPHCTLFGMYDGDNLIGTIFYLPKDYTTVQLKNLAFLPQYQGKGLGHQLMAFFESYAKKQKIKTILLTSRVTVEDFYAKQGYSRSSEIIDIRGIPHVWMSKNI